MVGDGIQHGLVLPRDSVRTIFLTRGRQRMGQRLLLSIGTLLCTLVVPGCDIWYYATATATLVSPIDSVCLNHALEQRLGPPKMKPVLTREHREPPALWLYFGGASFTQTY